MQTKLWRMICGSFVVKCRAIFSLSGKNITEIQRLHFAILVSGVKLFLAWLQQDAAWNAVLVL